MNCFDRLESYKKLSEARRELFKKRRELLEKEYIIKYANCANEVTVGDNKEKIENLIRLLQLILDKRREVKCLLNDTKSVGPCDISSQSLKSIMEKLCQNTLKLELSEKWKNTSDKDLANVVFSMKDVYEITDDELVQYYKMLDLYQGFVLLKPIV